MKVKRARDASYSRMQRQASVMSAAVLLCAACSTPASLPDTVTVEAVREVRLGMSRQEVERLLGPPVAVEEKNPKFFGTGAQTLLYFHSQLPVFSYPKLWIHLRDGRVEEVYAKRQGILDSDTVYSAMLHYETAAFREIFPSSQR